MNSLGSVVVDDCRGYAAMPRQSESKHAHHRHKNLGGLLKEKGEPAAAEPLLREALKVSRLSAA